MAGKRVLVTGGCGFIGHHLASMLRERGDSVRVLDIDPVDLGEDIEILAGSILDEDLVARAIEGMDQVFHLAANPNLWLPDKDDFYRINTRGTEIVLDAARKKEVERVVYTSTESILKGTPKTNARPLDRPIDERIALSLDDMPGPYCRSKYLAEERAMTAAETGLPVVIVNPTLPIGPGDRRLTPPTRMLLGFLSGSYPAYLDCAFNMIDARDAALGHILAAERGRIGERYILGGENLFLHEVLAILSELSGRPMPKRRVPYWLAYASATVAEAWSDLITKKPPAAPLTGVRLAGSPMTFDCTKTAQELGLQPRPVRTSLEDTLAWFAEEKFLPKATASGA
jgi:dihydroflavonol-4-reductase